MGKLLSFHLNRKIARYPYNSRNKNSHWRLLWICLMQPAFLSNKLSL